jgi:hypothetical protein
LQEFATAVKQLAHKVYSTLPEDHKRSETGTVFADGVEDTTIKIQLLLGEKQTVSEVLRQALELQAMLLPSRPHKTSARTFWGSRSPTYQAKRHKTIGILEQWNATPLLG